MTSIDPINSLDAFQLGPPLGKGGMGIVYRARQISPPRQVAIKFLTAELLLDKDFKRRFEQEARIATRLEHPHILPIYHYGQEDGRAFLVMRLVEGGSLHERINKGPLKLGEVRRLFDQIAEALCYAHEQGVIHRDLKPNNVLLDTQNNIYLTDFGLAKMTDQTSFTPTGAIIGTAPYISPEQWKGEDADEQTDIYALGIVLFEMLTGELPFKGKNPAAIMRQHLEEPIPALASFRGDLPFRITDVMERAIAKERSVRYQTVEKFLEDMDTVLTDPTPYNAPTQIRKPKTSEQPPVRVTPPPSAFTLSMLEWCNIPAGRITIQDNVHNVEPFRMSRYPITNAQFQVFIDDPAGYNQAQWWTFSRAAVTWHQQNPQHSMNWFRGEKRPRELVCWYEAMAFCYWLSHKTGLAMTLPTEAQWQRAAQGDKNRVYPWGIEFNRAKCNTSESGIKQTSDVDTYRYGASQFEIFDMCGNVMEWCLTMYPGGSERIEGEDRRVVRGGSWGSTQEDAKNTSRFGISPGNRNKYGGFRIVTSA